MWIPRYAIPRIKLSILGFLDSPPKRIPVPIKLQPVIEAPRYHLEIARDFSIDTREWLEEGDRDAILAQSGMGKSYLAGVIVEEVIESGGLVFIIDPEGENYTLGQRYNMLIVGGEHSNFTMNLDEPEPKDIDRLVRNILGKGINVIFDLSNRTERNQRELFTLVVGCLFKAQDIKHLRRPVKLIIEEARVFAPQKGTGLPSNDDGETCLSVFENIATRGRKRGINMLVATQRPASISKDIISQCNRFWFGGMQSTQDCKAMRSYLDEAGITEDQIRSLNKGEFFFYAHGKTVKIKSRPRKCKHGGATPLGSLSGNRLATRSQFQAFIDKHK